MELPVFHKALGDKTRWDLLNCLIEEALCGKALSERLGIAPSVVSQQVNFLQRIGLVTAFKRGYWTFYEVNKILLGQFQQGFNEWFNQAKRKPARKCRHRDNPIAKRGKKEALEHCQTNCLRTTKQTGIKGTKEGSKGEGLQ